MQVGLLFWRLAPKRRRVAHTNLNLCYPELPQAEREKLAKDVFEGIGISFMETLWTWLGNQHKNPEFVARISIEGLEILQSAQSQGRGVLLVGAHLMALDVVSSGLAQAIQVDVIYRYNKNPLIERLMVKGRGRYYSNIIEREDTRAILKSLKDGNIIWYAADQDYGAKHSVFANFYGVPAATITGTARLASFRNSPVVIMSQYRDRDAHRWKVCFEAGPESFPGGDAVSDAQLINDALEKTVRRAPEQYLWLHRRFKTRPPGEPKLY